MEGLNRITGAYVQGMYRSLGLTNAPSDTLSVKVAKVAMSVFVGMYQGAKAGLVQPFHLLPTPIKFVGLLIAPITGSLGFVGGAIAGVVMTLKAMYANRTPENSGQILSSVLWALDSELMKRTREHLEMPIPLEQSNQSELKNLEKKALTRELQIPGRRLTDAEFKTGFNLALQTSRETKAFEKAFRELVELARENSNRASSDQLRSVVFSSVDEENRERLRLLMQVCSDLAKNDPDKLNRLAEKLADHGVEISPVDRNYLVTSLESLIQNQEFVFKD